MSSCSLNNIFRNISLAVILGCFLVIMIAHDIDLEQNDAKFHIRQNLCLLGIVLTGISLTYKMPELFLGILLVAGALIVNNNYKTPVVSNNTILYCSIAIMVFSIFEAIQNFKSFSM